jgi:hypothetical protein
MFYHVHRCFSFPDLDKEPMAAHFFSSLAIAKRFLCVTAMLPQYLTYVMVSICRWMPKHSV